MTYCHISAQCDAHAIAEGKIQAREEAREREIMRIVSDYPDPVVIAEEIIGKVAELACIAECDDIEATHRAQRIIERCYDCAALKQTKMENEHG